MRIAVGGDGAGFPLKQVLLETLVEAGHEVIDAGSDSDAMVDYPEFAFKVSNLVASGQTDRGILVCGTGIGMSIAANKVAGVRAALCHDMFGVRKSRSHNDANVLCLGAWDVTPQRAEELVEAWIEESYTGGRHVPRLARIAEYEGATSAKDTDRDG
jgi:ribose 5-phosphate isomerase B